MHKVIKLEDLTADDVALIADRFWSKVNKAGSIPKHCPELGPCWEWTAGCVKAGYGSLQYFHQHYRAHRLAWFLEHGRWPDPWALHRCDNRKCVRASHLFEGDHIDNMRDAAAKGVFANSERMLAAQKATRHKWNQQIMDGMAC